MPFRDLKVLIQRGGAAHTMIQAIDEYYQGRISYPRLVQRFIDCLPPPTDDALLDTLYGPFIYGVAHMHRQWKMEAEREGDLG